MNVDNAYKDFCNLVKEQAKAPSTPIDEVIQFFVKNEGHLTQKFKPRNPEDRDPELGEAVLKLATRISEEKKDGSDPIKKLLKKIKSFGKTRLVSVKESRGVLDKNTLGLVLGHLAPEERKIAGVVSKEWRFLIKNPSLTIASINNHPKIPIMEYGFENYRNLLEFTKSHGKELEVLNLKDLEIDKDLEISIKELIELTTNCPNVKHLITNFYKISDEGLAEVAKLKNLQTLDLSSCYSITKKGLAEVAKLKNLRRLDLNSGIKITDEALAEIAVLNNLHTLNLSFCLSITDKGLVELGKLENLKELNLGCCQITDEGLIELVKMKNLQTLLLLGTEVTKNGKDLFKGRVTVLINN